MIDPKFQTNRLFEGAREDQLEALRLEMVEREFGSGDLLFSEGMDGNEVFLIAEGSVRISKEGRGREQELLDLAGPGDFIGEMAVIDGKARSARATAVSKTVAGVIANSEFDRILDQVPVVALNVGRSAVGRLRQADEQFIEKLLEAERLSLLGRMMGSIVHDYRNPINIVLQATHYMKGQEENPMIPKLAKVIEEAVSRMLKMTQEMLDFSRGVTNVDLEETTIGELLDSVEQECLAELPGEGIQVVRELRYGGPVTIDRYRFQRLILNLVKNAKEAMPDGGRLTIASESVGDQVEIHVSDTGCGMPPDIADRVFDSFVTHGKKQGTGLGMAIAKAVVDAHHGEIRVESTEGEGSTFHISVPREQGGAEQ